MSWEQRDKALRALAYVEHASRGLKPMTEPIIYHPCDIGFSRSDAIMGRMIRFCTWSKKESKSVVNHVYGFTKAGDMRTAEIVESLWHVVRHTFWNAYGKMSDKVTVFRPINLTPEQSAIIVKDLLSDEGENYPFWQFPLFFADWLLFGEKVVTRKLLKNSKHKVCSTKTSRAWAKAGLFFDKEPYACTPDDMYDFCINNPDKYELILPLKKLSEVEV